MGEIGILICLRHSFRSTSWSTKEPLHYLPRLRNPASFPNYGDDRETSFFCSSKKLSAQIIIVQVCANAGLTNDPLVFAEKKNQTWKSKSNLFSDD